MAIYDDKTQGIIKSGNYFFINAIKSRTEAIFKASYIVGSSLHIDGKITASFDLIIVGDVEAEDIDIKGSFICLGNCDVQNSITVQGKIFGKNIRAKNIEVHDEITANEIVTDVINADGNIIIGQTLAVEELAKSGQKIICGETAYGAGKISAQEIITGEELDMDDGMKSVVDIPNRIYLGDTNENQRAKLCKKYAIRNDYNTYLNELHKNEDDKILLGALSRWRKTLDTVSGIIKQNKFICYDIGLLLSLIELSNSSYLSGWERLAQWQQLFIDKFKKMANKEELEIPKSLTLDNLFVNQKVRNTTYGTGVIKTLSKAGIVKATVAFDSGKTVEFIMDIAIKNFSLAEDDVLSPDEIFNMLFIKPQSYGEWLSYLNVLKTHGDKLNKNLYNLSMDLIYSSIGIKAKFIMDRLNENGWKDND